MVRPSEDMLTVEAAKERLRRSTAFPQLPPPMLHCRRILRQKPVAVLLGCLAMGVAAGAASKRAQNLFFKLLERMIEP